MRSTINISEWWNLIGRHCKTFLYFQCLQDKLNYSWNSTGCFFSSMKCLPYFYINEEKLLSESHIFNFLLRLLLLFHSCTCASAHTILYSKLECWCFTHWRPDRPAQLTCLWYARMFFIWYIATAHICFFNSIWCQMNTSYIYILFFPRMVARYAPPISYNFLNLIRLGPHKETIFEKVFLWICWPVNFLKILFLLSKPIKLWTDVIPCIIVCCDISFCTFSLA